MIRKLSLALPIALALFGLAACADEEGTTAKEPAITSPPANSPATSAPTNPVTGTVPGPNSSGASPTAPSGSGSAGGANGSGAGGSGGT
jgi:hypothetical protein